MFVGASDLCLGPKQTESKDGTTDFAMHLTNITASHLLTATASSRLSANAHRTDQSRRDDNELRKP